MAENFIMSYADLAILIFLLAVSALIGLHFSFFGGMQKTNDEYLLAGKDMSIFPIAASLMATFLSSPAILGIPAEMYLFGTHMAFMNVGFVLGPIIAATLFLPIYFNTGISTPFEYLEKRFGKTTRRIFSLLFLFKNLTYPNNFLLVLFSGVSLYAPALALSAVTNLSLWISVICIGTVCTFYCTIGGIKAVIWTDVFQTVLMYTCCFSIVIKGCLDLGGAQVIFKKAYDGGRIQLPTFTMDFSVRYTMWNILLQSVILIGSAYVGEHNQVQRMLTLRNLRRSKIAIFLSVPLIVTFQLLCCSCGLIFYVYFQLCDPVTSVTHPIDSYDQLMPYYVTSAMREYPGLSGLCIAGIFSTSLSTISSSVNSMAAVTYEDIIRPLRPNVKYPVFITKISSVFYGVLIISVTFVAASMGNLIKSSLLICGILAGPLLAVFLLASLTTIANQTGINLGLVTGFLMGIFLAFITNERHYPLLPIQNNCSDEYIRRENLSMPRNDIYEPINFTNFSTITESNPSYDLLDGFSLSFMWITPLSFLVCIITGYFGSWITSYVRGTYEFVQPKLLSPIRQQFCIKNVNDEKHSVEKKFLENIGDSNL